VAEEVGMKDDYSRSMSLQCSELPQRMEI